MAYGTILHINMVGLMAAIEEGLDPAIRGRPFVVANHDAPRACVLDLSPVAHREGLRKGMPLFLARNLVPGLVVRKPRAELCRRADEILWCTTIGYTPLVERAGQGHIFADLTGTSRLHGVPEDAAQSLRFRIIGDTGLGPTLALASSKTASKVATRVFRPAGFVALSSEDEGALVRCQPVGLLPGVGPSLGDRFRLLGIDEIGDLADLDPVEARAIGPRGPFLVARARGMDDSPVNPDPPERRSLRGEVLFEPDTADPSIFVPRLAETIAQLAFELRKTGSGARGVSLTVGYTDGTSSQASARSVRLLCRDDELAALGREALARARTRRVRIRRLGIALTLFGFAGPELDLFEPAELRKARLQTALDRVRRKHGDGALMPCSLYALANARGAAAGMPA